MRRRRQDVRASPVRRSEPSGRAAGIDPRGRSPDFGARAAEYDRIRPVDDNWWRVYDVVVREADLRGRRVIDIGCGTGRLSRALAERESARVWGVDATPEMLEQARARVPRGVGLKLGGAEELPFRDAWFERAVMWLVVHLVDRPRAFAEARRVLDADGRFAVVSFDASHFDAYWLNPYFPSLEPLDRGRFPTREELERDLAAAGFGAVRSMRISQPATLAREEALMRIREGHISTFDLLPPEEVAAGRARAERELPERVEYALEWLIAVASA